MYGTCRPRARGFFFIFNYKCYHLQHLQQRLLRLLFGMIMMIVESSNRSEKGSKSKSSGSNKPLHIELIKKPPLLNVVYAPKA